MPNPITRACAIGAALVALAPVALAAPVPKGAELKKLAVAYVHDTDARGAATFKKFLDAEGFAVELVARRAVARTDFTKYGLIVIGSDTESDAWGDDAKTIANSGKPVLALGEGGYTFFGRTGLKLDIGAPMGWHGNATSVLPVDATSPLWKAAEVPAGKALTLYKQTNHVGIHLPKPPANVVLLGREENDKTHYALVQQGDRYVLWGFTAGPDSMTADGRKVFVATCRYTAELVRAAKKE